MDELAHQIKHAAQQQSDNPRPFVYAHISSYDPKLHRVRVVFPSLRDEANNPVVSSWMPLESHWVGPSWGFQVAPIGGATQQNPTQGEMVQVHFVEHRYGVTSCAKMFFNQVNQPPFTDLKPGEMGMKHKDGAIIKFTNDKKLVISSALEIDITAPTTVITGNVTVTGSIIAGFGGADQVNVQTHKHPTAAPGGPSPPTPGT
jgi:phage baseplate assembly protein gpV